MAVGKWSIRLAAIVLSASLAWLAVSQAVAHLLASGDLDRLANRVVDAPLGAGQGAEWALRLRPGSTEALNARNSDLVSRGAQAQAQLAASLAAAPLDSVVIRNLATAAGNAGDAAKANRFLAMAGAQTRRDTLVQQSLYYRGLADRDYAAAFRALDPLLRRGAVKLKLVSPDLAAVLSQPAAVSALAGQLAAQPPWRSDMIRELGVRLGDADQLSTIFDQMTAKGSPPSREEKRQLVGMWVKSRDYSRAAQAAGATVGAITDGEFNGSDVGAPFNWLLQSAGQITAELAIGSNSQRSLRAGWPGERSSSITEQLLLLSPGAYRFSGTVRVETLPSGGWITWTLSCDRGTGEPLAEARQTEEGGWTDFSSAFTVPANCPAVWLKLTSLGGESRSYGAVWYDHLTVTRVGD
ncbi:MAG: hypothetical protein JWM33_2928 [Caulobacteraceae bacterium]|nr:hypothetical protein [Caulobacteraceae bacterium]